MSGINKNIFEVSCLEWLAQSCRMNPLNITVVIGWNHTK